MLSFTLLPFHHARPFHSLPRPGRFPPSEQLLSKFIDTTHLASYNADLSPVLKVFWHKQSIGHQPVVV